MTKSKRIVLNTLASYGRSLLSLFVGVYSSRWFLMGFGKRDLGLMNVVGGLIGVVFIIETVMNVAVSRFYAYAIGQASVMGEEEGRDEVCRWFNVVLLIYSILPILVFAVGYPVGMYAVRSWLVIPPERMDACVYMFRCSIGMTFAAMFAVPYVAMYRAHQNIVEITLFDVAATLLRLTLACSLLYVACDRLVYAATFSVATSFAFLVARVWRAVVKYPACRVRWRYMFDLGRHRKIFSYFFWEIFSCTGNMTREKGPAFILNKRWGSESGLNAAWSIANTLSSQATALSGALTGALLPAVTAEEGAGDRRGMIAMAFRTCKFSALLILLFSIPLIAEMDEVLRLWLKNPPEFVAPMSTCILIAYVVDKIGLGHHVAISAHGKIGLYHSVVGSTFFLSIPIALVLIKAGIGPIAVGVMFIICYSLVSLERIVFARYLVGMPILPYLCRVVLPLAGLAAVSYAAAHHATTMFEPSFLRIVFTTLVSILLMAVIAWLAVLDREEKAYAISCLSRAKARFGRRRTAAGDPVDAKAAGE